MLSLPSDTHHPRLRSDASPVGQREPLKRAGKESSPLPCCGNRLGFWERILRGGQNGAHRGTCLVLDEFRNFSVLYPSQIKYTKVPKLTRQGVALGSRTCRD